MKDFTQLKEKFQGASVHDRKLAPAIAARLGWQPTWSRLTVIQAAALRLALEEAQGDAKATPALDALLAYIKGA